MATCRYSQPLPRLRPRPVTGHAVAGAVDAAELLGVDVDDLARMFALVADHGRARIEGPQAAEAETAQHETDGGQGHTGGSRDARARPARPPQALDLGHRFLQPGDADNGRAPSSGHTGPARRPPGSGPTTCRRCAPTPNWPRRPGPPSSPPGGCGGPIGVDQTVSYGHSCERSLPIRFTPTPTRARMGANRI